MEKIDTSEWKEFRIGDLFEKLELKYIPDRKFNKANDISLARTDEYDLPLVNAKHSNNGIMYYGRSNEWESEEMTIDIVADGAASTGDVYAQPQRTGVLYNAYLIKPVEKTLTENNLLFLATVIQRCVKDHFGYDNKCTWDRLRNEVVKLPATNEGKPDFAYMDSYMREIFRESEASLASLRRADSRKIPVKSQEWKEYSVGDLFDVSRPPARSQAHYSDGKVPFIASGNYNNGVVRNCEPKEGETLDAGNCISVSPLDGAAFYQPIDFLGRGGAGSAIILLRNENLNKERGLFIAAALRASLTRFSYNDQITSHSILSQPIRLPTTSSGSPDWEYMETYMKAELDSAQKNIEYLLQV